MKARKVRKTSDKEIDRKVNRVRAISKEMEELRKQLNRLQKEQDKLVKELGG